MAKIQLDKGLSTIVDPEDFEALNKFKWISNKQSNVLYARRYVECKNGRPVVILMHRQILDAPKGRHIDHINRNGLDNRRKNLRYCTVAQNQHNQFSARGSSKFKGVHWVNRDERWRAGIKVGGKAICLGSFRDEEEAAETAHQGQDVD